MIFPPYGNQSHKLLCKFIDWFLHGENLLIVVKELTSDKKYTSKIEGWVQLKFLIKLLWES